ncbi:MAG: cysteine desulfurase [Nitrososphaerota archaeon]
METVAFNVEELRNDFPILSKKFNGKTLAYLDNAATSQKPRQVIKAICDFYEGYNANIHRGVYEIEEKATMKYERTREATSRFIGAESAEQIIFTRNTTESINLVAKTWGASNIRKGDKIVVSLLEHHSNVVPWQVLAKEKGALLEYINLKEDSTIDLDDFKEKIAGAKLLAITQASNVLGTLVPVKQMTSIAHQEGCTVLVDGAQSAPHMPVSMTDIGCDFFAFSSHKMLGPTGVGVLYGKREILDAMPPYNLGGDMISEVHKWDVTWNELPWKFEAGTSNIADVIAYYHAIEYLQRLGMERVREHEKSLTKYALKRLSEIKGLRYYGPDDIEMRGGIISFTLGDVHPHDIASILSREAIAIRSGYHCAQPLHEELSLGGTARASFYIYNTEEEVDRLAEALNEVRKVFAK